MRRFVKTVIGTLLSGFVASAATLTPTSGSANQDPFAQMDRIFRMQMQQMELMKRQMDRMFRSFEKNFQTPTLMQTPILVHSSGILTSGFQDKGDRYELRIKTGDLNNSKVEVTTRNNMITVKVQAQKQIEKTDGTYGKIISYTDRSSVQSFTLPPDADPSGLTTRRENDALLIVLPKKRPSAPATKAVKTKELNASTKK